MFSWYARMKDGSVKIDESKSLSFSAFYKENKDNIEAVGVKVRRFKLTGENGKVYDRYKYFKYADGVKIKSYEVVKQEKSIENPTEAKVIYHMLKYIQSPFEYHAGITVETDKGSITYDEITGQFEHKGV